jgi:putative membrane protein
MMHGFGFGGFGGFGWIGMIINLVITILVVVGIIWLVVWMVRKGIPNHQVYPTSSHVSPKEILQARYARGEITREQYQQMLEDLG